MSDTRVRTPSVHSLTMLTISQGPAATANKLAMSKALGAAFLNHQVEQLEKSVNGPNGNWRDRRYRAPTQDHTRVGNNNRRPPNGGGRGAPPRAKGGAADRAEARPDFSAEDKERPKRDEGAEKDADIIVVDASVLVHALSQVKKWCRDGRQEVVIVPLEGVYRSPPLRFTFHDLPSQP